MKTAYLALGANIGDRVGSMREAISMIGEHKCCSITAISSFYETKPVGVEDQPYFLNAVIAIDTTCDPYDLLALCNEIEQKLGRKRTIRWGPRVIDIDVLLYESVMLNEQCLIIPHPRMMERAFVLVPLAEIAPDLLLPSGVTSSQAAALVDQSGIFKLATDNG